MPRPSLSLCLTTQWSGRATVQALQLGVRLYHCGPPLTGSVGQTHMSPGLCEAKVARSGWR